ncbi:hypothetical protein AGMMS49983_20740 [Clostridia bacterium]|nr:hypothetical protein AGMMS49983_20740 [Clostridia bacterium]
MYMEIEFNESAFRHGISETDVRNAVESFVFDEEMDGYSNKYMLLGFDVNGLLIEIMYNIVDEKVLRSFMQ